MRSAFGWSLPPGVSQRMIDEAYGGVGDEICDVCGQDIYGDCICPECPRCGGQGDPQCYEADGASPPLRHRWTGPEGPHGLVRSLAQVLLRAELDRQIEEENQRMELANKAEWDD